MKRGSRRPIVPHVCPANPSGEWLTVSVAGLRSAGLSAEADRLEEAIRIAVLWSRGRPQDEDAIALATWGCCRHDALAVAIRAANS